MASTAYPMTPSISMLHDRMDTGTERRRKRPPNTGSQLLDNQENYRLFELLGSNNVSLYAAVVELLTVDSQRWRRFARGVISLVKDYENRAYYLRLYDLIGVPELIWEFRLYKNFQSYMTPKCNQLLTFEGEFDGQVFGLNFSSPDEARSFKGHLDKRYEQERKTMAAREPRSTLPQASSVFSTAPPPPPAATLTASPFTNGVTPVGTIAHHSEKTPVSSGTSSFFRKNKKKDKKPRIRKEDISNPTNFQHKAHVGWDQDSGFSNNVDSDPMDESIKNIIRAAGQDPNNLSKKTIKFVYDFIERYEENTTSDPNATAQFSRHQAPPPPVPISQPISQWAAPPPPPPSRGASYAGSTAPPSRPPPPPPGGPGVRAIHARPLPQVPPSVQETRPHAVPPPPPPPSLPNIAPVVGGPSVPPAPPPPPPLSSTAPAAPPPPPSLSSSMPPPPPPSLSAVPPPQSSGRGDLLAQIQAGKQLRSVTTNAEKKAAAGSGADARGDVMAQIRLGANLKKVDHAAVEQEKRKSAPTLADMGGIAGALAKALEERRMNMCIDDSSDDDESDEKNEWSD